MKKQLLSLSILSIAVFSNAQVIFRQDFSTLNADKLNGQNSWTNNSSNGGTGGIISGGELVAVSVEPLSYAGYGNASKSISIKQVDQDGPGHLFATPITAGTYYFSFLGNFSAYPTATSFYDVLRLMNGGAFTTSARVWVQPGSSAAGFKVGIKIGDSGNPGAVTVSDYVFNQTHLFVVKYVINPASASDDTMSLYIDPVYTSGEPAIPALTAPLAAFEYSNNIDRIAFPYNTPKAGKAVGKIGMVSVARTWNELNFPETLATREANQNQNISLQYEKGKLLIQQTGFNNSDFSIISVDGKLIYHSRLNAQKNQQFTLGQVAKGIYFFKAQNGKENISKKFIINN
jgi:hypothetical protein